uniref:Twinkle protein, mitochondrial n=1 Tax=Lygus hesperus TaxID=30085 RepID=A0A0A9YKZ1_LYGHE
MTQQIANVNRTLKHHYPYIVDGLTTITRQFLHRLLLQYIPSARVRVFALYDRDAAVDANCQEQAKIREQYTVPNPTNAALRRRAAALHTAIRDLDNEIQNWDALLQNIQNFCSSLQVPLDDSSPATTAAVESGDCEERCAVQCAVDEETFEQIL